jgi:hypothetical protein
MFCHNSAGVKRERCTMFVVAIIAGTPRGQCLGCEDHVAIECQVGGCLLTRISRLSPQIRRETHGRCGEGKIFESDSVHIQQHQSSVALNPI